MHPALRACYGAAGQLARAAAALSPAGRAKWRRALHARRGIRARYTAWARQRDRSRSLLWIHAPSVGEGLQARVVLELVRARHPDVQLAYTFFSPSAERFARALIAIRNRLLKRAADAAEARAEIHEIARTSGIDLDVAKQLDPATLLVWLAPGDDVDEAKLWLTAELLYLDALHERERGLGDRGHVLGRVRRDPFGTADRNRRSGLPIPA